MPPPTTTTSASALALLGGVTRGTAVRSLRDHKRHADRQTRQATAPEPSRAASDGYEASRQASRVVAAGHGGKWSVKPSIRRHGKRHADRHTRQASAITVTWRVTCELATKVMR